MVDDIRIKDLQSTASYMESDDYLPIDSLALGNRKIPFTGLMDSEDDRLPTTDKTPRGAITEHEGDISEIKQSLSVLTETLYSTSYIKKQGNNVFINFGTDKIYNLINNVTIPSAFRPSETIRLPIIVNNTDNSIKYIGRVIIYNTGTLAFKYMSSYANEVDILTGSTWEVLTTVSYMI